jgi:hypothetical protein
VFNGTFNNIAVLSVEETRVPGLSQVIDKLIGTDCISSHKSNYNMIMATVAPHGDSVSQTKQFVIWTTSFILALHPAL